MLFSSADSIPVLSMSATIHSSSASGIEFTFAEVNKPAIADNEQYVFYYSTILHNLAELLMRRQEHAICGIFWLDADKSIMFL